MGFSVDFKSNSNLGNIQSVKVSPRQTIYTENVEQGYDEIDYSDAINQSFVSNSDNPNAVVAGQMLGQLISDMVSSVNETFGKEIMNADSLDETVMRTADTYRDSFEILHEQLGKFQSTKTFSAYVGCEMLGNVKKVLFGEETNLGSFLGANDSKVSTNAAWVWGKDLATKLLESTCGQVSKSWKGLIVVTFVSALIKGGISGWSDLANPDPETNVFISSLSATAGELGKSGLSNIIKKVAPTWISMSKHYLNYDSLDDAVFAELLKKGDSSAWDDFIKTWNSSGEKVLDKAIRIKDSNGLFQAVDLGSLAKTLSIGIGVDWAASVISNGIIAWISGDFSKEYEDTGAAICATIKPGSAFLKSSTKLICATAGELIGGKAGKLIGTYVGMAIGDAQVSAFGGGKTKESENWCFVAGAVQLVGAVAGAAIYVAIATALSVTPVGWVVGIALVVGAAVGFVLTKVVYELCKVDWNAVGNAIGNAFVATGELVCAFAKEVVEDFKEVKDKVVEVVTETVETVVNTVTETVVNVLETAYSWMKGFICGWA